MRKKFVLYAVSLLFLTCLNAQTILKGRVISAETKKALPSVSVYINNTSIGAITNDKGYFILRGIPPGNLTLVVSYIGYETVTKQIDKTGFSKEWEISLKPKADELEAFSVSPPEPDGWKKWGSLFTEIFLGRCQPNRTTAN